MQRVTIDLAPHDFAHYAEQARQHLEGFTHHAPIQNIVNVRSAFQHACEAAAAMNLTLLAYARYLATYERSITK